MKKLTYGMVGGGPDGFIGDAHRRSIAVDGCAQLVAGCFSRKPEKSAAMGEALGIDPERCYVNYEEMAKAEAAREDGIDFVVVVTPNVTHYPICKAFLEAGINVSCDKPLCFNSEQAEELVALAKEKDLLFLVTYTYTGHVTAKQIREYIKAGKLGKVRTVMAEYPQGWLAFEGDFGGKQGEWRSDPEQSGGVNCLGDIGTHAENLVTTVTGSRIKRLLAKMDIVVPDRVLDDNDFVLFELENGANGMIWACQYAIGSDNSLKIRVFGEKGTIYWSSEDCEKVTIIETDGTMIERHRGSGLLEPGAAKYAHLPAGHPEGWFESMGNLYHSFTECIQAKRAGTFTPDMIDFPTVEDGADGVRFIEKCLESNRGGNVWVDF